MCDARSLRRERYSASVGRHETDFGLEDTAASARASSECRPRARDAVQTYSALLFQNLHASERERSPPLEIQSADRWKLSIAASRAAVKDARPVKSFLVGRVETGYG